nr:hypothetical protein [uncultured Tolumonas sp.]
MLAELKSETSLSALSVAAQSYRYPILTIADSLLFDGKSLHKLAIELATLAAAK